jgi:hypothetical protein
LASSGSRLRADAAPFGQEGFVKVLVSKKREADIRKFVAELHALCIRFDVGLSSFDYPNPVTIEDEARSLHKHNYEWDASFTQISKSQGVEDFTIEQLLPEDADENPVAVEKSQPEQVEKQNEAK